MAVIGGACALAGCQFKGQGTAVTAQGDSTSWSPQVSSLRVYPSTRFVREQGGNVLNARIELLDQMGDSMKASGTARFDLFASDESGAALGQRLYHWDVALHTLEDQRLHFDEVTRAYLFRLQLDDQATVTRPTMLRVTFTRGSDGKRLQTQAPIERE